MGTGILSLLLFLLDIYCIYRILMGGGSTGGKVLWIIIVLFLPVLGPILWFLLGRA